MKYYEINETAAKQSRSMWSMSDYIYGSDTAEYRASVDNCYSIVDSLPDDLKDKGETMADRYARRLAEWYNKKYRIDMMCPSILISGGSNFPTRKKEKQNAAFDRHYKEYEEIQAIPQKIKKLLYGTNVIKSSDKDALEQLRKKLERLEKNQDYMKKANAYYRKNNTLKGFDGLTDEEAASLDNSIKNDVLYKVPYAPYQLTNNNANIRRIKKRITEIENLKNVTEISADNLKNDYNTELFKVIENTEIMRLQLIFDDKPSAEIREILKKNGFKWSPSNSAWQRQLTDNAKRSLKRVIEELHM